MRRFLVALVVLFAVLAAFPAPARAETGDWFLPIGGTFAAGFNPKRLSNGAVIGGEASLVRISAKTGFWAGGYGDAVHDSGPTRRASASVRSSAGRSSGWMAASCSRPWTVCTRASAADSSSRWA